MKSMRICITLSLFLTFLNSISATPDDTSATLFTTLYNTATPLLVNLGYARYQGYYDSAFGLNVFKGYAMTFNSICFEQCSIIDSNFPASDMPLLQSADSVGNHPRHRGKITPLSMLRPSLRSVHSPALRRPQPSMASTLDLVMRTAYSSMSTHPHMRDISQSLSGFVR